MVSPPTRPSPLIIGDPWWGYPRCTVCNQHFNDSDNMVRVSKWKFWKWLNAFAHRTCLEHG